MVSAVAGKVGIGRMALLAVLVIALFGVAMSLVSPTYAAALVVNKAEMKGGQLRVEGSGAQPGADISINGVVMGTADNQGRYKVQANGFSAPTCKISVTDSVSGSVVVSLARCVPTNGGLSFNALEIGPADGALAVPATPHPAPMSNTDVMPAGLPQGTIVEYVIQGVVTSISADGLEWKIGSQNLPVYLGEGVRLDNNPGVGDLVKVIALRTVEPGPIVAERIVGKAVGPQTVIPASVETALLYSGVLISTDNNVWVIGDASFNIVPALTEVDPTVRKGVIVIVSFAMA